MLKLEKIALNDLESLSIHVYSKKTILDKRGGLTLDFEGEIVASDSHISMKTSTSAKGVARGLHHQRADAPQIKIISVVRGSLIDFVYDPSDKEGRVYCFNMDARDAVSVVIPMNYAHGFIAKSDVVFNYICLGRYDETKEIIYNILGGAAKALKLGDVLLSGKDASSSQISVSI
jgi:dTDP-4-dehydrorhamnose 3,5-epimerase-like enzyme